MEELELNKPYSAKELCEKLFNISYDSFRRKEIKERYLKALGEAYDYKYEKRKYVLLKWKKSFEIETRHKKLYKEVYSPRVANVIGNGKWDTGTGVAMTIYEADEPFFLEKVQNSFSSVYSYTLEALRNEYDIADKQFAKGYYKGYYGEGPDFMSDEEIKEWNEMKSSQYTQIGKDIVSLTEDWAGKGYSVEEFKDNVAKIASLSYASMLVDWIKEKGYVPVLLNYYEPIKIGVDFEEKDYEWS